MLVQLNLTLSRPNSKVKVRGKTSRSRNKKCSPFGYECTLRRDVLLAIRRVLCTQAVGATSSEACQVTCSTVRNARRQGPVAATDDSLIPKLWNGSLTDAIKLVTQAHTMPLNIRCDGHIRLA